MRSLVRRSMNHPVLDVDDVVTLCIHGPVHVGSVGRRGVACVDHVQVHRCIRPPCQCADSAETKPKVLAFVTHVQSGHMRCVPVRDGHVPSQTEHDVQPPRCPRQRMHRHLWSTQETADVGPCFPCSRHIRDAACLLTLTKQGQLDGVEGGQAVGVLNDHGEGVQVSRIQAASVRIEHEAGGRHRGGPACLETEFSSEGALA